MLHVEDPVRLVHFGKKTLPEYSPLFYMLFYYSILLSAILLYVLFY